MEMEGKIRARITQALTERDEVLREANKRLTAVNILIVELATLIDDDSMLPEFLKFKNKEKEMPVPEETKQ